MCVTRREGVAAQSARERARGRLPAAMQGAGAAGACGGEREAAPPSRGRCHRLLASARRALGAACFAAQASTSEASTPSDAARVGGPPGEQLRRAPGEVLRELLREGGVLPPRGAASGGLPGRGSRSEERALPWGRVLALRAGAEAAPRGGAGGRDFRLGVRSSGDAFSAAEKVAPLRGVFGPSRSCRLEPPHALRAARGSALLPPPCRKAWAAAPRERGTL